MKTLFEQNGGAYTKVGDYYIPNLTISAKNYEIGKYGRLHRTFLKENYPCLYSSMLMQGTLLEHISEVDRKAKCEVDRLVKAMAKEQGVTEELKAQNQMLWVGMMNNLLHSAEEIILKDLIYTKGDL